MWDIWNKVYKDDFLYFCPKLYAEEHSINYVVYFLAKRMRQSVNEILMWEPTFRDDVFNMEYAQYKKELSQYAKTKT